MTRTIGLGRSALLAAMMAASVQGVMNPGITIQGNEDTFGTYRASSRTHKRYLRQHHLGKFKKGRR